MWRGWAKAHDDSFLLTGAAGLRALASSMNPPAPQDRCGDKLMTITGAARRVNPEGHSRNAGSGLSPPRAVNPRHREWSRRSLAACACALSVEPGGREVVPDRFRGRCAPEDALANQKKKRAN